MTERVRVNALPGIDSVGCADVTDPAYASTWQRGVVAVVFVGREKAKSRPATIEDLYNELPRNKQAVKGLWLHQGDVLRTYVEHYERIPDLALELPTGTGKTLPGLIICEWVRQGGQGRVAYACPTSQLARQVARTAEREGVPAVVLVGRHHDWLPTDEARYDGRESIAITNYNTIFNSSPKLAQPRLIVFDDAHAGEQFVGEQFGVSISRWHDVGAYKAVLDAVAPLLSGLLLQRLRDDTPDPGAHHQVRLLTPALKPGVLARLDAVLNTLPKPHNFQLAMIRSGLASCMVYISYGAIQVRPMIPPTFDSSLFTAAKQRIYLSATLGGGGELERAFGRRTITRLPLPGTAQPRSGRRLFVFPEVAAGDDSDALISGLVGLDDKAVVLSQDTVDNARAAAAALAGTGVPVFGKNDVEHDLSAFAKAPKGVLGLANRYDGLDLPDDDCRMVVLNGLPNAQSLQEKFLAERADAGAALAERLRTRVVQGAGRCTRGPSDYAVVVMRGSDLTRYLRRPEVRDALDPELQAEVEFGWLNSVNKTHDQILENVEVFLEHEQDWREGGEPLIAEIRRDKIKTAPPGSDVLQESASLEVEAWELAYQGDWIAASSKMEAAARAVGKGSSATRGYRSVLLYLAGLWLQEGATTDSARARARRLVSEAGAAAERGVWLKETTPLPSQPVAVRDPADSIAIAAIAGRLAQGARKEKLLADLDAAMDDVTQTEAARYERGLTTIGKALGANAFKPVKDGRCDSAWLWDPARWITLEAKSAEGGDRAIPLKHIRQANTQLALLANDQQVEAAPAGSVSVIVSARGTIEPDDAAAANPNLYLTSPDEVSSLATDVREAWSRLLSTGAGSDAAAQREQVASILADYGCLPTQATERLTQTAIRPLT